MTDPVRDFQQLKPVLGDVLDGRLSNERFEELKALLRDNESARDFYVRHVMTHAMLEWQFSTPHLELEKAGGEGGIPSAYVPLASHDSTVGPAELKRSARDQFEGQVRNLAHDAAGNQDRQPILRFLGGWSMPALFAASVLLAIGAIALTMGLLGNRAAPE